MASIHVVSSGVLFRNALPQLKSEHGYFPSLVQSSDGELIASVVVGEAFESVDLTTEIARSADLGCSWSRQGPLLEKSGAKPAVSDFLKLTYLGDSRLLAFGYRFPRLNPNLPLGNPQTGGLLNDEAVFLESSDRGRHWNSARIVETSFDEPVEASAPLTRLSNGDWVTPIANFKNWNGSCPTGLHGRLLRSSDQGHSWEDRVVSMEFPGRQVAVWEQRLVELADGRLVIVAWNYDFCQERNIPNHYVISEDGGMGFTPPCPTGVLGQTTSMIQIENNRLLAFHCLRSETDQPGIHAYLVDLDRNRWDITAEQCIWRPGFALWPDGSMPKEFAFLKFGQPSAVRLKDGTYLVVHWQIEQGQGTVNWTRIAVRP